MGGNGAVQGWDPNDLENTTIFSDLALEVEGLLQEIEADRAFLLANPSYSSIPLVFYEGGQGLVARSPNDDPNNPATLAHANTVFDAANHHSLMRGLYLQLLNGWRARRGDVLFNHYVNCKAYSKWGRYGALEHQRQDHNSSVKYTALMDFIATLP